MRHLTLLVAVSLAAAGALSGQADSRLLQRWVGLHQGRPLHLDFHGDTLLVVNDAYATDYHATRDSLVVFGDTSFAVRYWFALDRLLLETAEGRIVTMSRQDPLARPIEGVWVGSEITSADPAIELRMTRAGTARWRQLPEGAWTGGEWDRQMRLITFTWLPDSTKWRARYDPGGSALLVTERDGDTSTIVLRRIHRR